MDQGVSHTPVRGVNTPQLSYNTHGFSGKGGTEGKGREGKGKGREKGKEGDPKGWLTPPMFLILKNTL